MKIKRKKKERKIIQSVTVEPSRVARMMKKTGQQNFSQITRDALDHYEKYLDKKNK